MTVVPHTKTFNRRLATSFRASLVGKLAADLSLLSSPLFRSRLWKGKTKPSCNISTIQFKDDAQLTSRFAGSLTSKSWSPDVAPFQTHKAKYPHWKPSEEFDISTLKLQHWMFSSKQELSWTIWTNLSSIRDRSSESVVQMHQIIIWNKHCIQNSRVSLFRAGFICPIPEKENWKWEK